MISRVWDALGYVSLDEVPSIMRMVKNSGFPERPQETLTQIEALSEFAEFYSGYVKPFFLIDVEGCENEVVKSIPRETIERAAFIIETSQGKIASLQRQVKIGF